MLCLILSSTVLRMFADSSDIEVMVVISQNMREIPMNRDSIHFPISGDILCVHVTLTVLGSDFRNCSK